MKKLITVILVLSLLSFPLLSLSGSMYENCPDVSGLSYIELMYTYGAVQRAIWASDEWTSVDVPAGVYLIGTEIPAGHWTITPSVSGDFYTIGYGTQLNATQTGLADGSIIEWLNISSDHSDAMRHSLDIVLEEGFYLYLGHTSTFTPYIGKKLPDFHFD